MMYCQSARGEPCPEPLARPLIPFQLCWSFAKKLGVKTKFVHRVIHFKKAAHKKNYPAKVEKELFDNMATRTHTNTHAHTWPHTDGATDERGSVINLISAEPETYLPDINTTQPFMPTHTHTYICNCVYLYLCVCVCVYALLLFSHFCNFVFSYVLLWYLP